MQAIYPAMKGGVEALSRSKLTGEDIRVDCVNPGTVDTAFVQRLAA